MPRFVASRMALRLAQTARAWRVQSPATTYLHVEDDVRAFLLDEAMAARLDIEQRWAQERARGRQRLPGGLRYSSEGDYDDAHEIALVARRMTLEARANAQSSDASPDSTASVLGAPVR